MTATIFQPNLAEIFLPRPLNSYKGMFGHVLVVGGDYGMGGAVRIAAEAALRSGAGLVTVVTQAQHVPAVMSARPEIMAQSVDGEISAALIKKATCIALGPGLGQSSWSQVLFRQCLLPSVGGVLDADGLNLLALNPQPCPHFILTPHVQEAARLLNTTPQQIQKNREQAARDLQAKYQSVVVLKGHETLICDEQGQLSKCIAGNPGMASPGMGDSLTGIIASLRAQGHSPLIAAQLGVFLHATAGDLAAQQYGQRGLLASDLLPFLRQLVNPHGS